MKVRVLYFASIREAVATESETIETQASTVAHLREQLRARGGAWSTSLAEGMCLRAALDRVLCDESCALHDDAEVAFFPPVTGG